MTRPVAAFLIRRACFAAVLIVVVTVAAFVLVHFAPGDALGGGLQSRADIELNAIKRAQLGLDRPLTAQLAHWIAGLARFDFGDSVKFGLPVRGLVATHLAATAELAVLALISATLIGIPLGVVTGSRPRSLAARATGVVSAAVVACPPMVTALGVMLIAASFHWSSLLHEHALLPVIALGLPIAAMLERLQSSAVRDALAAPDLLAGAARGLAPPRLLWLHAARHALRPILGIYGIVIGTLFSGSFVLEMVMGWPGLGRLTVDALVSRDVFLVAGCTLAGTLCLALGNLIADAARVVVDPRLGDRA